MRLGVSDVRKITTTNDDNDGDGEEYVIYLQYMMLCGDTAYFHKKILPEVVLGEFHAAIRAPSQPGKWEAEVEAEAETRGVMQTRVGVVERGGCVSSSKKCSCGSVRSR